MGKGGAGHHLHGRLQTLAALRLFNDCKNLLEFCYIFIPDSVTSVFNYSIKVDDYELVSDSSCVFG